MLKSVLAVLVLVFVNFQVKADIAPGTKFVNFAIKPIKDGGLGMELHGAFTWVSTLPKNVLFNFETFEKNFKADLKEKGSEKIKEAVLVAIEQTKTVPIPEGPKPQTRPRTLAEVSDKYALLDSTRHEIPGLNNSFKEKDFSGFYSSPWGGFYEVYGFEENIYPGKDSPRIRIEAWVDRNPFNYPCYYRRGWYGGRSSYYPDYRPWRYRR
ncbi:MAG: hypothetical protein JWQ35_480 [Bacteriovoracaceae bacterium]|nr:hypothetical protein [Bacteriovoracaceae bacterium]